MSEQGLQLKDPYFYAYLLSACATSYPELLDQFWKDYQNADIVPTAEVYEAKMIALLSFKRLKEAIQVLRDMAKVELDVTTDVLRKFLEGFVQYNGDHPLAKHAVEMKKEEEADKIVKFILSIK